MPMTDDQIAEFLAMAKACGAESDSVSIRMVDEIRRLRTENAELVCRSEAETRELTDVLTENAKLRKVVAGYKLAQKFCEAAERDPRDVLRELDEEKP